MGSKKAVVVAGFEISRGIFSQALMSLGRYASVFQCASLKEATRDACGYDVVIVDWIVEEGPLAAEMVRALCGVLNPDATLIICLDPNMESRELRLSLMTAGADGIISRAG
ncbi:MAG: hypothetical protein HYU35_00865, partial [Parcubacteria group bacterium]|nr:hypothetical protein [Parcubacteria group bacterium]